MENIYLNKNSVEEFSKNIKYNEISLNEAGRITYEYFKSINKNILSILDIGVGNGNFTFPFIDGLLSAGLSKFYLDCFDISDYMLKEFEKKLNNEKINLKPYVKYFKHDAEKGLLPVLKPNSYDLIIITFVLHYIRNLERLLSDVYECCKKDGLFIQAEIIGDLRNVDGKFDTDSPKIFMEFWKEYFKYRQDFSPWLPDICVSDISKVLTYLIEKKWFRIYKTQEFNGWKVNLTWNDLCQWIVSAPVSSLGVGLTFEERSILSSKMLMWLKERQIDLSSSIEINWGVRLIWLVK